MPVNPNEAPKGYIAVASSGKDCRRCAFRNKDELCALVGRCSFQSRNDGVNVYFVEKPPEGSEHA